MFTTEELTRLLGWCTFINVILLSLSTILILWGRQTIARFHGKLFGEPPETMSAHYFEYLARYKLLIIQFNLVPYLALKIMALEAMA